MTGDYELVDDSLARLVLDGCGAARQRAAFARHGGLGEVVSFLAAQTRPS
jgi:carboxylate-amine ligase